MRLSSLFEDFCSYLSVERGCSPRTVVTYRKYFGYFLTFATTEVPGNTVLREHFTPELCRRYQYSMAQRELEAASIRVRLAVLASFGKWSARRGKLSVNPLDMVTRPRRKSKLPVVPRWTAVEGILGRCRKLRDKAVVALLGYGGLRRSEVVALDVGDYDADFGLRRVKGKGEHEAAVALPEVARAILDAYLERERPTARFDEPLFLVRYKKWPGEWQVRRMDSHRVWKLIKDMGRRAGVPELHPHAFRHACGVELLKRNGGNLRVVQEHLRHQDIGTTVTYTRIVQHDLQKAVSVFDTGHGNNGTHPVPHGTETKRG